MQTKRSVAKERWNASKGCVTGKAWKALELNQYPESVRMKIYQIHRELLQDDKPITAFTIIHKFNGEGESPKMLLEVFREHNKKYRELIDRDYVKGTVLRYERTVRYLEEMLQSQYHLKDTPLKELNDEFVLNFEHFVKVQKNCAQNAVVKYLKNLKKITRLALTNKWIVDDPFSEIRFHQTQSNRYFLTKEELNAIINKKYNIPRLETIRDIFVFCALSGLAFADAQHLTLEHVTQDSNGDYWIRKPRKKTNNMCNIPLLDIPRMIAEKYKSHPECVKKGVVLPVPSNQRMNSYLKEIADVCFRVYSARKPCHCLPYAKKGIRQRKQTTDGKSCFC